MPRSPVAILEGHVAFAIIDDVVITITHVPQWTDAGFRAYLEAMEAEATRIGAGYPKASVAQFMGAAPTGHHRDEAMAWMKKHGYASLPRSVLFTESTALRLVLTLAGLAMRNDSRAYAPNDLANACSWVTRGLQASARDVLEAVVQCRNIVRGSQQT
jgi:hypothetical protein